MINTKYKYLQSLYFLLLSGVILLVLMIQRKIGIWLQLIEYKMHIKLQQDWVQRLLCTCPEFFFFLLFKRSLGSFVQL